MLLFPSCVTAVFSLFLIIILVKNQFNTLHAICFHKLHSFYYEARSELIRNSLTIYENIPKPLILQSINTETGENNKPK